MLYINKLFYVFGILLAMFGNTSNIIRSHNLSSKILCYFNNLIILIILLINFFFKINNRVIYRIKLLIIIYVML